MVALREEDLSRPARIARVCIARLGLQPPVDVFALAAACHVPILEQPPGGPSEDAFLAYSPASDAWAIFVNPSFRDPLRRRFTLAHELGHYLLHREYIRSTGHAGREEPWMEDEAHEFARELLMPADSVLIHARMGLPDWQVRTFYGVSMAAWRRRLADFGIAIQPRYW